MNAKSIKAKKIIFWIVLLVLVFGLIFGFIKLFYYLKNFSIKSLSPIKVELEVEDFYSDIEKQKLEKIFQKFINEEKLNGFKIQLLKEQINQDIDVFKDLSLKVDVSRNGIFRVSGVNPIFIINEDFVVAENRKIYLKERFELFDLDKLKKINVVSDNLNKEISENFYNFLKKVPTKIFDRYNVTYEKPTLIKLYEIEKKYEVIVDEKILFDEQMMFELETIYNDVTTNNAFNIPKWLKNKKTFAFDLRFHKRIIAQLKDKGEGSNDKKSIR